MQSKIVSDNQTASFEKCGPTISKETLRLQRKNEMQSVPLIWEGTDSNTKIQMFKLFLKDKYSLHFETDKQLHQWSVENFKLFWDTVWIYFDIVCSQTYDKVFVKTGPGFLDNDWFTGATFNYAENVLRIRDNTVAIIYTDEEGNEDEVTFNKLFDEVELYAAAFRKNGLSKGDRVACYMSNRKEAIFALLAVASVGAMWGAAVPYFGAQAAANIISKMDPKFLITVDRHQDNGKECDILGNLPIIVEKSPTLEKVIIVNTIEETSIKNISHIKKSCLLRDFLQTGKRENGTVPTLLFEQLPANHPLFISFTSGTTGISKGPVHPAAVLLPTLANIAFVYNLKNGDTLMCCFPMGWSPLINLIPCLVVGVKLLLYCGSPYFVKNSRNIWDIVARYKVTFFFHVSSVLDNMEKNKIFPSSSLNFDNLKVIGICSCPVKLQNVEYIRNHITKYAFIGNHYAATESIGIFSGFYLNSPSYGSEIQLPALGVDLRCLNSKGEEVIGEMGCVVIATPTPSLPLYLWKDSNNTTLNDTYLSQYPGMWCQSDLCWVNPKTGGIAFKGRSDDTFIQDGDRFGSADIYFAIHGMEEIEDYICVGQKRLDDEQRVLLFVKMRKGFKFTPSIQKNIEQRIEAELFADCVPKVILEVKDIPYNLNNKRMESIVRKIVETNTVPNVINIRNPDCLKYFCNIPEICNYNKI